MSKEVIDKYVAGGLSALRRMEQASLRASEVSHETLMRIIRQNEDTEYGQKYDFRNIHSYEEYTLKVPFSEYSDYEPYIERMVLLGAKKLITASDVQYFAHTSGSSGAPKMIPRTKEELDILYSDIFMRAFGLREWTLTGKQGFAETGISSTEGKQGLAGRGISAIKDVSAGIKEHMPRCKGVNFMETQTGFTPSGIAHGAISETLNHPADTALCSVFPEELVYSAADYDRRHVKLLFALREKHLGYLMSTFSPMMYDMIVYLQKHWRELCEDLEAGEIRQEIAVDRRLRLTLNAMLQPDPKRADEIRSIMSEFGNGAFIPLIWPDLSMVACVGTAAFAPYMSKIRQHLGPDIAVDYLGYVASESTVAAQINEGEEAYMLLPYSGFFEFIPVDEGATSEVVCSSAGAKESTSEVHCSTSRVPCSTGESTSRVSRPLLMEQLEVGREYELVVTNLSGFYRYRIGDVIRVVGFHNRCPMIVFSYRKNQLASMYGEKITESVMQNSITRLAEESGTLILEYSIYPHKDSDPGHYVVLLESDVEIGPDLWPHYSEILDKILCEAHDSYCQKIEKKIMLPLEVRFVQPQTFALYRDLKVMEGASPNQIKPLHVINDDKLKRFFLALLQR